MSGEEMIRRLYQVINRGDIEALGEFIADDMVEHEEFPGLQPGKEGVLAFFRYLRTAFPDLRMTAEDVVSEGEKVAVRGTMTGTHEGEFMDIPATGNRLEISFADFFRFEDGKVAEHWGTTDTGAMMQQLGKAEG